MPIVFARAAAAALLAAFPRICPAQQPSVVPFELRGDIALVRVAVNGQSALLILDTGSGVVTLDSAFADSAGIEPSTIHARVLGARSMSTRFGTARSIRVGTMELTNVSVAATSAISDVQARVGHDVHGSIGWDLFRRYVAVIDYEARTATFHEPNEFSYTGTGVVLPVSTTNRVPVVRADLVTRTHGTIAANLVLDLGSASYALRLSTPFIAAHEIDRDTVTVAGPFGAGVGGVTEGRLLRLPQLRLGTLVIARPSTALSQAADGAFGNDAHNDGTIGVPVFRRTRMIVDLPHGRVILEPRGRLDVPDSVDESGVSLVTESSPPNALRVAYVVSGSAAARAGVQVGDEVLSIDGHSTASMLPYEATALLRPAGAVRRLALRRGTSTITVSLQLAPIM
jgi:hypothetical protein